MPIFQQGDEMLVDTAALTGEPLPRKVPRPERPDEPQGAGRQLLSGCIVKQRGWGAGDLRPGEKWWWNASNIGFEVRENGITLAAEKLGVLSWGFFLGFSFFSA